MTGTRGCCARYCSSCWSWRPRCGGAGCACGRVSVRARRGAHRLLGKHHDRRDRGRDKRHRRRQGARRTNETLEIVATRMGRLVMGYLVAEPDSRNKPMTAT